MARATTKPKPAAEPQADTDWVYFLRTCNADMTSHNGFVWPESGWVEAPDWNGRAECGGGLHGLPWGRGDGSLLNWDTAAKWLVFRARPAETVAIDGAKSKVRRAEVVHVGDRLSATTHIISLGADPALCVGGTATAGDRGTATAGEYGTATAGYRGTATAGDGGTATAGDGGIIQIKHYDAKASRYRIITAYVGEDGIEARVAYRVDGRTGKLKKAKA